MSDGNAKRPELTIVGGQPIKKPRRGGPDKIEVPVGLEKALYHAARDEGFKAELLRDTAVAIAQAGINLRRSELKMLAAISPVALEAMIDKLVPENPRRRKFMGLVAASAASLAAGSVLGSCDHTEIEQHKYITDGSTADTDIDGDSDTDTDTATDTGSDTSTVDNDTGTNST